MRWQSIKQALSNFFKKFLTPRHSLIKALGGTPPSPVVLMPVPEAIIPLPPPKDVPLDVIIREVANGKRVSLDKITVEKIQKADERGPKWYQYALEELGTTEVPGNGDNPRIIKYMMAVDMKHEERKDAVPWCAAFTCFCLEKAGIKSPRTLWARDFASYGHRVEYTPTKGDICVFARGSGGHVGFYHSEDDHDIYVLGGNQGDKVSITNFPKSRLMAIRRP